MLNSDDNFESSSNTIGLNLSAHENHQHLAQKIRTYRKTNANADNLVIKVQRAGLQLGEMQIPISAYDRTQKFKDGNELFYSTTFKTSKNPKLIKICQTAQICQNVSSL